MRAEMRLMRSGSKLFPSISSPLGRPSASSSRPPASRSFSSRNQPSLLHIGLDKGAKRAPKALRPFTTAFSTIFEIDDSLFSKIP
eukprot:scaffold452_cov235-Pinguiococcus_pyrenoidosus.AAC.14